MLNLRQKYHLGFGKSIAFCTQWVLQSALAWLERDYSSQTLVVLQLLLERCSLFCKQARLFRFHHGTLDSSRRISVKQSEFSKVDLLSGVFQDYLERQWVAIQPLEATVDHPLRVGPYDSWPSLRSICNGSWDIASTVLRWSWFHYRWTVASRLRTVVQRVRSFFLQILLFWAGRNWPTIFSCFLCHFNLSKSNKRVENQL